MTTNNYYQVNVNNVQGNVNIQINGEKTQTVSSPPGPEKHREQLPKMESSSLLVDIACAIGIGLIAVVNFCFTKVICPSLEHIADKTSMLLLGEKIETPEVIQNTHHEILENDCYQYLTFWRYDAPTTEDIRIDITDRREYSTEIMRKLQKERYPKALYGCSILSSKTKLAETLILE